MIRNYIINFISLFANLLMLLIFLRVILSWVPANLGKFGRFIFETTEPILRPIRKVFPPVGGVLDLSPIIVFVLLQLILSLIGG